MFKSLFLSIALILIYSLSFAQIPGSPIGGSPSSSSGDVTGPATNSDAYVPQWDGANSKKLKGGFSITANGITLLGDTYAQMLGHMGAMPASLIVQTGANNVLTYTGNFTFGVTLTGNTSVTFPTSGTLLSTTTTPSANVQTLLNAATFAAFRTSLGVVPLTIAAGSPTTNSLAGSAGDFAFDSTGNCLYQAYVTGTPATWWNIGCYAADGAKYMGAYNTTSNPTCNAGTKGMTATVGSSPVFQVCDGSNWVTYIKTTDFGANVLTAAAIAIGTAGGVQLNNGSGAGLTGLTAAQMPAPTTTVGSGSISVTTNNTYVICTTTCAVTLPVAAAGIQTCVRNAPGSATVITLVNRASQYYELTNHSDWATANKKLVSGGAATDSICVVGYDGTHYATMSSTGTWTDTSP